MSPVSNVYEMACKTKCLVCGKVALCLYLIVLACVLKAILGNQLFVLKWPVAKARA